MTYFYVHGGQCNGYAVVDTTSRGHVYYVHYRSKRTITKSRNRKDDRANPKQTTLASEKQMTNSTSELLNWPLNFCSTSVVRQPRTTFYFVPEVMITKRPKARSDRFLGG